MARKPSVSRKTKKPKTTRKSKPATLKRVISKVAKSKKRKAPVFTPRKTLKEENEVIAVEKEKFSLSPDLMFQAPSMVQEVAAAPTPGYELPWRYQDNCLMIMPRDPWWIHSYWDISEARVNEVISSIPVYERQNLKWIMRAYDVTGVRDFRGNNANSYFDLDINFEANSWYVNVNSPEREWCVEIGFVNSAGKFFAVARSNIIKTPYFGISSVIDEEWVLPDDDYFKVLGIYDLGNSSLERMGKFEEIIKRQISSPLASWGVSSLYPQKKKEEKFFLETWTEVIVHGRTEADAEVTIEGKKVNLRSDGTFTQRYALPPGDFKFEVEATSSNKNHKRKQVPAVKRYNK